MASFYDLLLARNLNGGGGGSITPQIKQALLGCFSKVAWVDENGQDYWNTLKSALYSTASLDSISAVYSGSSVTTTTPLDDLKTDLVVTASWSDSSTSTVDSAYYTLSGTLTVGTSTVTVTYLDQTTTFNVTVTAPTQGDIFGTFTKNYALGKATSVTSDIPVGGIWNNSTNYRAAMTTPIENKNYVITVTDSTKYNVAVYDVTSNTPHSTTFSSAVLGVYYQGGEKTISWKTSDSATSSYIMIALKKNDNTAFTDAELANGAEAVFTYTES